jgi:hypothetical protein
MHCHCAHEDCHLVLLSLSKRVHQGKSAMFLACSVRTCSLPSRLVKWAPFFVAQRSWYSTIDGKESRAASKMDPNSSAKITDAAVNLVQLVNSGIGESQLKLQNTTNQHLAGLKSSLDSFQKDSIVHGKTLLQAMEELTNETRVLALLIKHESQALQLAVQKMDRARRTEFALRNQSLANDFDFRIATKRDARGNSTTLNAAVPKP